MGLLKRKGVVSKLSNSEVHDVSASVLMEYTSDGFLRCVTLLYAGVCYIILQL